MRRRRMDLGQGIQPDVTAARRLLDEGRLDVALRRLHQAFDHQPSLEAVRGLAEAYAYRGNWDKAEQYARAWISFDPRSDPARLFLVIVLIVLGKRADAAREAQVATSVNPSGPLAWAAHCYSSLPTRDPGKRARPNLEQAKSAANKCAEFDASGLLTQAICFLIALAGNDSDPKLPVSRPGPDQSSVDALRWLGTAEHSLGFDAAAMFLYTRLLHIDPQDRLALARAVQLTRANTTITGALVSSPWMIAALPAQLGLANLYYYARAFSDRQEFPELVVATLRTEILWRRAHSALRPLLGAALTAAGVYWVYSGDAESNGGKVFGGDVLLWAGLWLLGSWVYALWRLRHPRKGKRLVELTPELLDLLRRDTLPLKARSLVWPLSAGILASLGVFFFSMGFTGAPEDRPFGLISGPVMVGISAWVVTRWLMLRWRLRHPPIARDRA
jgi:tetratricopeptide (TPR) repeat protein